MYEYRTLSAKERAQVVENRRARGYPLHAPPHPFRHAGHYLITAPNYEHKQVMAEATAVCQMLCKVVEPSLAAR